MWNSLFEGKTLEDESSWSSVITLQDRLNVHGFEYKITGAGTHILARCVLHFN